MMQDEYFMTEIAAKKETFMRATSAGSIRTTNVTMDLRNKDSTARSKNIMMKGLPPRPTTASANSIYQKKYLNVLN
jgi:predicted phage tail protein